MTIALHHAGHALAHGGQPARIVSKAAHRHHAMGFDIGLVNDVQPVAIAKPVPQRMVRIVRAANGVEVVLLHDLDIAAHRRFVHHLAVFRVMLVPVNPADQQRFTVELQQAVADFNPAEADIAGFRLKHVALRIQKRDRQTIEFRGFCTP